MLAVRTVAAVHLAFLVYVLLGGFLAVRWPHALLPHAAAVAWATASLTVHVTCPLTRLEDTLRRVAGMPPLGPRGFVDHYLEGALYPPRYTPVVLTVAAVVVLASWAGCATFRRTARDPDRRADEEPCADSIGPSSR